MPETAGSEGYRAATERVAFFADLRRAVVGLSGAGALRVVNGLVSNDVADVPGGRGVYTFLLNRRGRIVADLRVLPSPGFEGEEGKAGDETLWLDTPNEALPSLTKHLRQYVPPLLAKHRVTGVEVYTLIGPLALEALTRWGADAGAVFRRDPVQLTPLETTTVRRGNLTALAVRREEIEGAGYDLYVDRVGEARDGERCSCELEDAVTGVGGVRGVRADWEILRVEHGLPVFGAELSPERLAQEAGQDDRAISFTKGCYTGQEVVARIRYRGHVNRHLRGLRWVPHASVRTADMAGASLRVPEGTDGSRPVGAITSAVHSPRFGPVGLGYVRREIVPGTVLGAMDDPDRMLRVTELPFT